MLIYRWSILFLLILISPAVWSQHEVIPEREAVAEYASNQLYIQLAEGQSIADLKEINDLISNGKINKLEQEFKILGATIPAFGRIFRITLTDPEDLDIILGNLSKLTSLTIVEKIPIYKSALVPNDIEYGDINKRWHLDAINAEGAWDVSTGNSDVTIAIVDDAILTTHPDLIGNIYTNTAEIINGIDDDGNGYIDDINGYDVADSDPNANPPASASNTVFTHGTHVAGIAAAESNNSIGVASIGYSSSIVPIKIKSDQNTTPYLDNPMQGVEYAIALGVDVINMSWGSYGYSAVDQLLMDEAYNQGIICVAAAGNSSYPFIGYPAGYTSVISVGALNSNYELAGFSNYSPDIDIYAPGVNIWSTLVGQNDYGYFSGTSMAAPIISGLVALMVENYGPTNPSGIKDCLTLSADLALSPYTPQFFMRRVNAEQAILCNPPYWHTCEPTACNLISNGGFEIPANNSINNYSAWSSFTSGQICSWSTYLGTPDVYPIDLDYPNHYARCFTGVNWSEGVVSNKMDITPGESYTVSFQYLVWKPTLATQPLLDNIDILLLENSFVFDPNNQPNTGNSVLLGSIQDPTFDYSTNSTTVDIDSLPDFTPMLHHYSQTFTAPLDTSLRRLVIFPKALVATYTYMLMLDNISVRPNVDINASALNSNLNCGECTDLTATGNGTSYVWEPQVLFTDPTLLTQTICPTSTKTYTVTAYDSIIGCTSSDTVTVTVGDQITDTQNSCGPFTWINGNVYHVSTNIPTWTLINAAGCDSVVSLNLTIDSVDISIVQAIDNTITAAASGAQYQWLDCTNNYSEIPGEDSQSFIPSINGSYAVQVTQFGCIDTSSCITINDVSINETNFGLNLTVYPNPTSGQLTVQFGEVLTQVDIEVKGGDGRIVQKESFNTIDSCKFTINGAPGSYFIALRAESGASTTIHVVKK